MMRQQYIDRICSETLSGRFGLSVISARKINEFGCPSAPADGVASLGNAAVWTSARSGTEQGKR